MWMVIVPFRYNFALAKQKGITWSSKQKEIKEFHLCKVCLYVCARAVYFFSFS